MFGYENGHLTLFKHQNSDPEHSTNKQLAALWGTVASKGKIHRKKINKRTTKCVFEKLQNIATALGWEQQYGGEGSREVEWMNPNVKLTNICHRKIFSSLKLFFPLFFKGH